MGSKRKNKLSIKLSDWGSSPSNAAANVLEEIFFRDRIKATWKNLGELASRMYDDPGEAFDILQRNSGKTTKTINLKRFYLIYLLEDQHNKKINKDKTLNKIIDENLEKCCHIIGQDYERVAASKTDMNKNPKLRRLSKDKIDRQKIIDRVVSKHSRVVDDPVVKKEYKKWQKEELDTKEFANFLKK